MSSLKKGSSLEKGFCVRVTQAGWLKLQTVLVQEASNWGQGVDWRWFSWWRWRVCPISPPSLRGLCWPWWPCLGLESSTFLFTWSSPLCLSASKCVLCMETAILLEEVPSEWAHLTTLSSEKTFPLSVRSRQGTWGWDSSTWLWGDVMLLLTPYKGSKVRTHWIVLRMKGWPA